MSERLEKPGIYPGIPYDDYASWGAERKSYLWHLLNHSVEHYEAKKREPPVTSAALSFGKMFHCILLTPELFETEYLVLEDPPNKRTKAGKAEWAEIEASGLEVVSAEDLQRARLMMKNVLDHKHARKIFKDERGQAEVSMLWQDQDTGVYCQGRIDFYVPGPCIFLDVKTTRNAHPEVFGKDAARYGYFMQASFYYDGLRTLTEKEPYRPVFVAVEKEEPFAVSYHEIDEEELEFGRLQYQTALYRLARAQEDVEENPSPYPEVNKLTPPKWATIDTIYD